MYVTAPQHHSCAVVRIVIVQLKSPGFEFTNWLSPFLVCLHALPETEWLFSRYHLPPSLSKMMMHFSCNLFDFSLACRKSIAKLIYSSDFKSTIGMNDHLSLWVSPVIAW